VHLPWYQIDKDAIAKCHMLARFLGVRETEGVGIGIAVWSYAFELAADGDFAGRVPDIESVAAAAHWPITDAPRLARELQRSGFLATSPDLRIRGLDRYRSAWERGKRNASKYRNSGITPGKPPANNRAVAGNVPATNQPQTQTQTQTQIHKQQLLPPARKKRATGDAPPDPRHGGFVKAIDDAFMQKRKTPYPFGPIDFGVIKRLLKRRPSHDDALWPVTLAGGWAKALDSQFPGCSTLLEFEKQLGKHLGTGPPDAGAKTPTHITERNKPREHTVGPVDLKTLMGAQR
jgi:hypothetical protein